MAYVLRIKFPLSYPVIYKTLRIDSNLTVRQAIQFVNETLRVDVPTDSIGLYIPRDKRYLDDNERLSAFPELQQVDEIEFKDRTALDEPPPPKKENYYDTAPAQQEDGGCCQMQ